MSGHTASNAVAAVLLSLVLFFRFLDVRLYFGMISLDLTLRGTLNASPACLKAPDAEINEQLTKCWALSFRMI